MTAARMRRRRTTRQPPLVLRRELGTAGISRNTGPLASAAWLIERGLTADDASWFVEVTLARSGGRLLHGIEQAPATHLAIEIHASEWGYLFRHDGRTSWIRVTDVPFVHGRDDFALLAATPRLEDMGELVRAIERQHRIELDRYAPWIRTSIIDAEPAIREWIWAM